jgi:hypothetical protein
MGDLLGWYREGLLTAGILAMSGALAAQTIDLNVTHLPATLQPGKSAQITLAFERDADVVEKRLVFVVEVRRAEDDSVFRTATFDNVGAGYTASTGSMNFVASIPNDTEAIYFNAYASPWSLNQWVVEQLESYPTNGTYTYSWVGNSFGVMNDVYYRDSLIAPKPGNNTTYCSGAAFEVGVFAALNYNALHGHATIGGMSVAQMQSFRRVWYGTLSDDPDPQLKLAALAIPKFGIGREITDWDEVQAGDFLQFWRTSGSGHNPIFVSWVTNASGTKTGIRYWGSQGSTNGLGYRNESFSGSGGSIDPARTFFGRLARPRDGNDIEHALVIMSTEDNPIPIGVPPEPVMDGMRVY